MTRLAVSPIRWGPRAGQYGRSKTASEATEQAFTPKVYLMNSASLLSALRVSLTFQYRVSVAVSMLISCTQ